MGECMSICQRDDNETKEGYDDPHKTPSRTKKNKTRIPQNVISDDDDDEDIPITKHISLTNEEIETTTKKIMENLGEENPEIKEKIRKAKKNWEYLVDRMIQKRIDILREIVKKEKVESESDEEEDEKIEDFVKETNLDKKQKNKIRASYKPKLNGKILGNKIQNINEIEETKENESENEE